MNLGNTIDRILKIEPMLTSELMALKNKWKRYPARTPLYLKQFLSLLNTNIASDHPKRNKIQQILNKQGAPRRIQYSFEKPTQIEKEIGVIPENIEGRLRRHDRMQIKLAKDNIEARLTHNESLIREVVRRSEQIEIEHKKLWIEMKDHFDLWSLKDNVNFFVRLREDNLLILTITPMVLPMASNSPMAIQSLSPDLYTIKLDSDTLKRVLKYLNITPPPGLYLNE